ncbi:PREDICTED: probable ATP-dependent RNA helicase DDX52 [Polistes canadensis]|uniref:probable ATP-dependent RNA helicase DDX52 n=1 Tax=Polistes canadensis TaxID=91411 RepID=UPI000718B55E|nr:PREDICTED: probable ATP-dependent RNA helicase DDX52 [Polistes canadensis]
MDAYDIFKKLAVGSKFNVRRFQSDAEKFKLINKKTENIPKTIEVETTEPVNTCTKTSLKRKYNEDEEEKQIDTLTLIEGISVPVDGSKIKAKKNKSSMTEAKKFNLEREQINQFRNQHHISVTGSRVPKAIGTFDELLTEYQVSQKLLDNMKQCGYEEPTPIQMQAIPVLLQNRQLLARAPTGSGKTAAFLLPIIHHLNRPQKKGFRAIILSPTRELSKQTYRECLRFSENYGFRVHIISKINQALSKYGPKSSQKFDILITTPKRLVFLLQQEPPAISLANVEWLIVDEADKLFEDGMRGFRDQLEEISTACTNPNLHRAMFSATTTPTVTKWCRKNLKSLVTVTVGLRNSAVDLIEQELLFVGSERGKLLAIRNIILKGIAPPVLVFVQSKERAQELFSELIYDGINVDVIHADRTQAQRDNVVRCFREGKIWVLICTEIMGRGIDFKGVNLVINYDFPPTVISYIHRIGRTGRAGHKGKAITFFTKQDTTNLRSIAATMRASGCDVPEYMLAMKKHSKKERRKLEQTAPKRETILTGPKHKRYDMVKKLTNNNKTEKKKIVLNIKKTGSKKKVMNIKKTGSKKKIVNIKKTGSKKKVVNIKEKEGKKKIVNNEKAAKNTH